MPPVPHRPEHLGATQAAGNASDAAGPQHPTPGLRSMVGSVSLSRRLRWLDIAIRVVAVGILVGAGFLAYSIISFNLSQRASSPAARAVENLLQLVRENPDDANARVKLADALGAAGRLRESTEQYQAALSIDSEHAGALSGLALLSMNQGEWRTAEGYWRRIIEILQKSQYAAQDQRLEKAYYYLGSTLMEVNEYEEASVFLREALRMRRDASDTHFLLFVAYQETGADVKAREHLEWALTFDPLMPEANYELGLLLLAEGDEASAAERFRISADGAPSNRTEPVDELEKFGTPGEHIVAAQRALDAGDSQTALSEARIAASLDPENTDAVRLVAQTFELTGAPEEALAAWERLLQLTPGDAEAEEAVQRLIAEEQ